MAQIPAVGSTTLRCGRQRKVTMTYSRAELYLPAEGEAVHEAVRREAAFSKWLGRECGVHFHEAGEECSDTCFVVGSRDQLANDVDRSS